MVSLFDKGIRGRPSLVHTPGKHLLRRGRYKVRSHLGRIANYAKSFSDAKDTDVAHNLRRIKVREISSVEEPASPGAYIIMAKSFSKPRTAIRLDPIMKADVDYSDGQSGGMAMSGSDQAGTDMRSDNQKSLDLQDLARQLLAKPPLSTENEQRWLIRVLGRAEGVNLFPDQMLLARKMFGALKRQFSFRKSADDALAEIAQSIQGANAGMSFAKAFTLAATSPEGAALYNAQRRFDAGRDPDAVELRKAIADAQGTDDPDLEDDGDGSPGSDVDATAEDDGSAGYDGRYRVTMPDGSVKIMEPFEVLEYEAADIRKSERHLTKEQAFAEAARLHPEIYKAHRAFARGR